MNNKILARIVALVLAVMMLGTVSFATQELTTPTPTGTVTADGQKTVLAFATNTLNDTEYTDGTDVIVAVIQDTTVPATITVDKLRVGDMKYVTFLFGNANGGTYSSQLEVGEEEEITVTFANEVTIGGTLYKEVAYAHYTYTVPTGMKVTKYGLNFNSYKNGEEVGTAKFLGHENTAVAADTTINFGAVIFAVPYGELETAGKTVGAKAVIETANVTE